jgi:hypothetical protein
MKKNTTKENIMKKNTTNEYEVKFLVTGIVGVTVNADSREEAIERAQEKLKSEGVFQDYLSYLDGREELCGYDNLTKWSIISQ